MKYRSLIIMTALLMLGAFGINTATAQQGKCDNIAWNHDKPSGMMSATLSFWKSSTVRYVYGGSSPTIPYKGTLKAHLESISFGGNLIVKLRKKGTKKWTIYRGMEMHKLYSQTYPWKQVDFNVAIVDWPKGSEIEILVDGREYAFGFTENNFGGKVMMIQQGNGQSLQAPDKFRSLSVVSSSKTCIVTDPSTLIDHRVSDRSIEPTIALTVN